MTTTQEETISNDLLYGVGVSNRKLYDAIRDKHRNRTASGTRDYLVKGSWRNLIDVYWQATSEQIDKGEAFYENARDESKLLGNELGLKGYKAITVGAGIISVLSPRMDWDLNLASAKVFIAEGHTNRQTNTNNRKAKLIQMGTDPMDVMGRDSHKTKAFYQAICSPLGNNEVWDLQGYGDKHTTLAVIDRHAGGAYIGKPLQEYQRNQITHWRVNKRISNAYFRGAKELLMPVNVFQAVVWNVFRDEFYMKQPYRMQRKRK